ncbi:hypothetical protein AJ79_05193 [Helicocarpus griseus UAMH5409]|uniref:Uncharacterized protein n=1 Tax=Helicocarpus griseus UAMH5409 TaxID=1447875 RepID=A0A2B7XR17_9EURO|nr:hypothetical protein AJ79_05193 [Helicocarpus griseus UAMH5409]
MLSVARLDASIRARDSSVAQMLVSSRYISTARSIEQYILFAFHPLGICVAKDNSCCDDFGGPGVTATTDGTPLPTSLYTPSHTPTGTPFTFSCYREESGEECCAKSDGLIYCPASGSFPNIRCYHPTKEICCSDGTVCVGEDCCDLVNASQITPTATMPGTGRGSAPKTTGTTGTTGTTATTSGSSAATKPTTSNVAAIRNAVGGMAPAALGLLGVAAWL